MLMSMQMLSHMLGSSILIQSIVDGEPSITGIRCMVSGCDRTVADTLYVVPDEDDPKIFHLLNRNDWITIRADNIGEALNLVLAIQDRLESWENSISDAAITGDVQRIADLVAKITKNPSIVVNTLGMLVACAQLTEKDLAKIGLEGLFLHKLIPIHFFTSPLMLSDGSWSAGMDHKARIYHNEAISIPYAGVFAYGSDDEPELVALSIVQLRNKITESDLQLLDVASRYLGKALSNCPPGTVDGKTALFHDLLEGTREPAPEMLSRLLTSIEPTAGMRMVAFRHCFRNEEVQKRMLASWTNETFPNSLSTVAKGTVIALISDGAEQDLESKHKIFFEREMVAVGISLPFSNPSKISLMASQAIFALGDAKIPGVCKCEDLACERLVENLRSASDSPHLVHPALGKLKKHDANREGNLYETLRCYLECERSLARCAQRLFIHKNTLLYRLKKIREIIGDILDDDCERLYLQLSFLIE